MMWKVQGVIRTTGLTSAFLGVVLSPIPFADEILLVPVYGGMTLAIGWAHGLSVGAIPWRAVVNAGAVGLAVRAAGNLAFAFVPGVAAVSNALSAAVLTEVLGRRVDGLCAQAASRASGAGADDAGAGVPLAST